MATRGLMTVEVMLSWAVFDTLNCKAASSPLRMSSPDRSTSACDDPFDITDAVVVRCPNRQRTLESVDIRDHSPWGWLCVGCKQCNDTRFRRLQDYVSAHPNAGLPNELGGYDQTPEFMAELVANSRPVDW